MPDLLTRLQAALAERYAVQVELGRGGMATVYLAEDRKHLRRVAIKVLKPELVSSLGPERFLREITLTAQLDHPHILPLLDSGEADGLLYYVMPYVDGESLRDRLSREKQLPLDDAVQIAREVADALGYAHSHGIVHRDIKPENILLAGGHARVADFGIARAVAAAGAPSVTATGLTVGTPAYMSPEQAAGDQDLDGRTDLYSLACVLYEMLTGEAPHLGATPQAIFAKRLSDPPPRASVLRVSVPASVDAALTRALARTPADRFPTAQAFAEELRSPKPVLSEMSGSRTSPSPARGWITRRPWVSGVVGLAAVAGIMTGVAQFGREAPLDPLRVVVVPFDDRTGDPSLEGLGELVADWVAGELARSAVAQVVPAASVRAHWRLVTAGSGSALSVLPQTFGAGTVVSGALRVANGRVRIEAEIIDARSGQLLQALEPLSAPRDSTGPLIAVTAQRVVAAVAIRLNPQFQWARPTGLPPSLDAFREFEAATVLMGQVRLPEALIGLYKAHAIDSSYLAPLLIAAAAHIMLGQPQKAESLLVALDPYEAVVTAVDRAHREWLFAWIHRDLNREYRAAEELFAAAPETFAYHLGLTSVRTNRPERALEAFPFADLESPWMKGFYLYWTWYDEANHMLGRLRGALDVLERGRRLHPDAPSLLRGEILVRAALGQVHEVDSLLERVVTLPAGAELSYALTSSEAALEFRAHGHRAAAEALLRQTVHRITSSPADESETSRHQYELARMLYWSGRWDDALPLFEELVHERPTTSGHLGFLGTTFGRLGRRGDALEIAERLRALEQQNSRGANTLWRARIAAVLGDQAEAVRLIGQAIGEGQTYGAWIHRDPDFHLLISYPPFQELVRPRG